MATDRKKSTNKKTGWSKRKATTAFVTSPAAKRVTKVTLSSISRELHKQKKELFHDTIRGKMEEILPAAYKHHAKLISAAAETKLTDITLGIIDHAKEGIVNRSANRYGYYQKDTLPNTLDTSMVSISKKVRTKFITGQPSSSSVMKMAEISGTSTHNLFNTETDFKEGRESLSHRSGFNQKIFVVLGPVLTPTVHDYRELFGMDNYKYPQDDMQTAYGLVKREKLNLKISNLNKFLPINMNIHLVEMDDRELTMSQLFDISFHSDIKNPSQKGKIPSKYQFENTKNFHHDENLFCKSVIVSKKAKLSMITAFKQNAKIAKTFNKKLDAGQIWDIEIDILLGAGICLDQLFYDSSLSNANDSQPSTYGIVLECVGVDTTLVYSSKNSKQEYIGTCPTSFCFEFKKSVETVNYDINFANGGFASSKSAIKLYRKDISLAEEFNISYDMVSDHEVANGYFVPVRSTTHIEEGGSV